MRDALGTSVLSALHSEFVGADVVCGSQQVLLYRAKGGSPSKTAGRRTPTL